MKTREQSNTIKRHYCGNGEGMFEDDDGGWVRYEDYVKAIQEMQANKQTCGFCVEPKEEKDYSDEEIKAMIDRMNEQPLQLIDTGCDQLREAAAKVTAFWRVNPSIVKDWEKDMHEFIEKLEKELK